MTIPNPGVTLATLGALDDHVDRALSKTVEPSLYVPLAWNDVVEPGVRVAVGGNTAIETRVAVLTVICAVPLWPPNVAVTVAVPGALANRRPAIATVATVVSDELHVESRVTSCVVPSFNVAVALNNWFVFAGIVAAIGVTVIAVGTALVTSSVTDWETVPRVTVIVTGLLAVATDDAAFTCPVCNPTAAIAVFCETQVA